METAREHGHCRMPAGERSGLPAAEDGGAGDAVDAEGEGAHAEVAVVGAAHLLGVPEGAGHVRLELPIHLLLAPTRSSSPSLRRSWPGCPVGSARPSLPESAPRTCTFLYSQSMCEMCQQMQLSFVAKCWCSCLVGLGVCWVVRSLDDVLCFDGISIVPRRRRQSNGLFINKNIFRYRKRK